jgi:F-type H+-transporting ATPase subunit epsilon
MTKTETFQCSVITPERVVLDAPATFVAFPAHDGEVGILPHRAPLVYKLGIGELRVQTPTETQHYFVDGGFAQMVNNRLAILTEQAKKSSEIQPSAAEKALADARSMPGADSKSQEARELAVRRAKTQVKIARQSA